MGSALSYGWWFIELEMVPGRRWARVLLAAIEDQHNGGFTRGQTGSKETEDKIQLPSPIGGTNQSSWKLQRKHTAGLPYRRLLCSSSSAPS